jgi:adenosylmethionine-8-amino-7-oxononanoate aminotransferase
MTPVTSLTYSQIGSEAMDAAMKLSRQYYLEIKPAQPKRVNFIARWQSYHGATVASLSLGGNVERRTIFEPILLAHNTSRVSPCYPYRGLLEGETEPQYVERLAQELEDEFQRLGPETVIAFVVEPIVGAALSCVPTVPGYLAAMKAVCDRHGALFICDEVMCGMGRSGTLHTWQAEGVVPDIQTIGKGLGGGFLPIAGVLIGDKVSEALFAGAGAFQHGHTYQGHPVVCASALEVQRIIREEKLLDNVQAMGKRLESGLKTRLGGHKYVGDIRGRGLFWGVSVTNPHRTIINHI